MDALGRKNSALKARYQQDSLPYWGSGLFMMGEKMKEEKTEAYAEYLRNLVEAAGKADPEYKIFGSKKHKYTLKPVIPLEKVRKFEEQYHIELPEEYVFFLTMVGNGGAGPYYGLYSLESLALYTECLESYSAKEAQEYPVLIDQNRKPEQWDDKIQEWERAESDQECDEIMKQISAGALVIGTQGCTYDHLLMWKGSEKGRIVYIDWDFGAGYRPFFTNRSFLEWYELFFKEIIQGHNVESYGYRRIESEESLRANYLKAADPAEKKDILWGFWRFVTAEPATIEFLEGLEDPESDSIRTHLLLEFEPMKGISVFEKLLRGKNPKAAIACSRRLLYFLSDCKCRSAKDIAPFGAEERNKLEERKTAVYVMGTCPDKMNCACEFKKLMRQEDYWLAHTALQAVSSSGCKEFLDTYEWMWEKYHGDKTMEANLITAFKFCNIVKNRRS